jgi:peptidoglycan LD-endopeptidase CwlK
MNWYLQNLVSAQGQALHLLDEATILGDNPEFICPLVIPREIRKDLVVLALEFFFEDVLHIGQMGVHRAIAHKVEHGFRYLAQARFPIASIVPIVAHGWDDMRSMAANNTSGFNYRYKVGSPDELSLHAYGLAFDINPFWNSCRSDGIWLPEGARYDEAVPGTITKDSWVATMWRDLGFTCGVDWQEPFDPQHIQMPLEAI